MIEKTTPERYLIHLDMGEILAEDQLDLLTRQLQKEILDTDVETVDIVSGDEIPEGTKAGGAITWGALAVEVLPTFLPGVVGFLKSWVMREKSRKVTIQTQVGDRSIKLDYSSTGIKGDELNELVSILTASMQTDAVQTQVPGPEDLPEEKLLDDMTETEIEMDDVSTDDTEEEEVEEEKDVNIENEGENE